MQGTTLHPSLQLPPIAKLSARVWRVMGFNPSPMTLGGTNTYVVGDGPTRILVDTGEGKPEWVTALKDAVRQMSVDIGQDVSISDAVFTHWHHDHVGGWHDLKLAFPHVRGRKAPTRVLRPPQSQALLTDIRDDDVLTTHDGRTTLRFLHTPGHTDDHVSIHLMEESAVLTGDCILGAGSSVFASYKDFMVSLRRIEGLQPSVLYPGHGPVVQDAIKYIRKYIGHREERERQIVLFLEREPRRTIDDIVRCVYAETTPPQLLGAAAVNVSHTLKKLYSEDRLVVEGSQEAAAAITVDDYLSSADKTLIALATNALCMEEHSDQPTPDGCTACETSDRHATETLQQLKELQWSIRSPDPISSRL